MWQNTFSNFFNLNIKWLKTLFHSSTRYILSIPNNKIYLVKLKLLKIFVLNIFDKAISEVIKICI